MSLASLAKGFRSAYLDLATIVAQLQAWHAAYPDLTRLTSIGTTPEGRDLWVLTVGADPDRARPTAWVDGNMHASELAGSSVALAIAEDFLAAHVEPDRLGLPAPLLARLRATRLFVMPRMSPDGAEAVLTTGRYVRSVPRDDRGPLGKSLRRTHDLDGDGRALVMRVEDPTGDYVANPEHPGLMSARRVDDAGPYYRVCPEGTIENWDGLTIPVPEFNGDNGRPQPQLPVVVGAGPRADRRRPVPAVGAREPRGGRIHQRAPRDRHLAQPALLRRRVHPPARPAPDAKMAQDDLAVFRQLEVWAKELTGYPVVSGYEEFLYAPDKPLHGDLTDYAYNQRGAFAFVVEQSDLFKRLEMPAPKKFVDYYGQRRGGRARLGRPPG